MKKRFAIILLISLMAGAVLSGCSQSQQKIKWSIEENIEGNATLIISSIGSTTTEKFMLLNKTTALDLLKNKHKIDAVFGGLIKCIDDVCINREYKWAFYVNNKFINSNAANYVVKDNDIIVFVFGDKNS